ncbi:helix-turn-helix domain-containing protein [Sphingomonas abietis]|uniref:Helix-turn-helix transcriptional regulator n=1 Tax=Sphingomonas abietis TaxID=3012344 RepID=A0ABY7NL94_9SPHN|nr:helix-turn-helix transcriptional regulator [Sphingomonas abietis]WBO22301.1 helix-turn-helix transcriptional regulator [Sphingomonas abietis]
MSNDSQIDRIIERIAERLAALGFSERKASLMATGRPDAIRYIRTRRAMPSLSRLAKLANVLQADPLYLAGDTSKNDWEGYKNAAPVGANLPEAVFDSLSKFHKIEPEGPLPAVIVHEALPAGHELFLDQSGKSFSVGLFTLGDAPIDVFFHPPLLKDRELSGFYAPDNALSPLFAAGSPVMMESGAKIQNRDEVVIGVSTDSGGVVYMLARLLWRTEDALTLTQLQPNATFLVPISRLKRVFRVVRYSDFLRPPEIAA